MTLAAEEFIRRFLLHVLPKGLCASGSTVGWLAAEPLPSATNSEVGGRRCTVCGGIIEVVEMILTLVIASAAQPKTCSGYLLERIYLPS